MSKKQELKNEAYNYGITISNKLSKQKLVYAMLDSIYIRNELKKYEKTLRYFVLNNIDSDFWKGLGRGIRAKLRS